MAKPNIVVTKLLAGGHKKETKVTQYTDSLSFGSVNVVNTDERNYHNAEMRLYNWVMCPVVFTQHALLWPYLLHIVKTLLV